MYMCEIRDEGATLIGLIWTCCYNYIILCIPRIVHMAQLILEDV